MKKALLVIVSLLVLASVCFGQYTTVTGSAIKDNNGNLANGTIKFVPSNEYGFTTSSAACCLGNVPLKANVTNGVFSLANFPAHASIKPASTCFRATVTDSNGNVILGPDGYRCLQPTGVTWSFDAYQSSVAAVASGGSLNVKSYSVAALASLGNLKPGDTFRAIDCETSTSCISGGGSTKLLVIWNGTSFEIAGGGGGGQWGAITGDLNDQTDLISFLGGIDSTVVHKGIDESITGTKTFSNIINANGGILPGFGFPACGVSTLNTVIKKSPTGCGGKPGYIPATNTDSNDDTLKVMYKFVANSGSCDADTVSYTQCIWYLSAGDVPAVFDANTTANNNCATLSTTAAPALHQEASACNAVTGKFKFGAITNAGTNAGTVSLLPGVSRPSSAGSIIVPLTRMGTSSAVATGASTFFSWSGLTNSGSAAGVDELLGYAGTVVGAQCYANLTQTSGATFTLFLDGSSIGTVCSIASGQIAGSLTGLNFAFTNANKFAVQGNNTNAGSSSLNLVLFVTNLN